VSGFNGQGRRRLAAAVKRGQMSDLGCRPGTKVGARVTPCLIVERRDGAGKLEIGGCGGQRGSGGADPQGFQVVVGAEWVVVDQLGVKQAHDEGVQARRERQGLTLLPVEAQLQP